MGGGMVGGIDTYILLTASGSGRFAPEVIKCVAYGVAIMNGRRYGWRDCKRYVQ